MPYVEGRVVHDADSHIMETSEMLADFASEEVRRHLLGFDGSASVATSLKELERVLARHRDPAYRADDEREILNARTGRQPARITKRIDRARSTCSASRASSCSTPSSTATARDSNARATISI